MRKGRSRCVRAHVARATPHTQPRTRNPARNPRTRNPHACAHLSTVCLRVHGMCTRACYAPCASVREREGAAREAHQLCPALMYALLHPSSLPMYGIASGGHGRMHACTVSGVPPSRRDIIVNDSVAAFTL